AGPNYIVKPGNQESLVPWNVANCLLGTKPGNPKVKVPITASGRWKGGVGFVGAATEEAINGGKQVAPPTAGAHCAFGFALNRPLPFLPLQGLALHACVWGCGRFLIRVPVCDCLLFLYLLRLRLVVGSNLTTPISLIKIKY
ncbi:hypothetical protein MUK42_09978, partial [Musa troglodytarum]